MRIEVFQREVDRIMKSIQDSEELIILSKIIGNNHRQSFINQLMIYEKYPTATACATYDYWLDNYHRVAIPGSRGIPAIFSTGKSLEIRYLFDYTQTQFAEGYRNENGTFHRWKMPEEQKELQKKEILLSWEKLLENISKREGFSELTFEIINICGRIALFERLGIDSKEEQRSLTEMLKDNHFQWDLKSGTLFTSIVQEILIHVEEKIKEQEIRRDEYESRIEQGISRKLERDGRTNEDEHREGMGRDGRVRSGENVDDAVDLRGLRNIGGNFEQDGRSDIGRVVRGQGIPERVSDADLRRDETIFHGEQFGRTTLSKDGNNVSEQNLDSVSQRGTTTGSRDVEKGETSLDGTMGVDRENEGSRTGEIRRSIEESGVGIGRDDHQDDRGGIESSQGQLSFINPLSEEAKAENEPFAFPFKEEDIQLILQRGGNQSHLRMKVLSKYSKDVSDEELANFLKEEFRGGNGFVQSGRKFSAWYTEKGIEMTYGDRIVRNEENVLSWLDAAKKIRQMIQSGVYATQVETEEAFRYERQQLAEMLWYIRGDLSDVANKENFFVTIQEVKGGGFSDDVEKIVEHLYSEEDVKNLQQEYDDFLYLYHENPSILRFHHYSFEKLKQGLNELLMPRLPMTSYINDFPVIHEFITKNELEEELSFGSIVSNSKFRIYSFFKEKHSFQDQINFLKEEYGTGGHSSKDEVSAWHDAKGITCAKNDCPPVVLPWSQVAVRVQDLIRKGKYLKEHEHEKYTDWLIKENLKNTEKEKEVPQEESSEIIENMFGSLKESERPSNEKTEEKHILPSAINYKILYEPEQLPPSERLKNNISAIQTLKEVELSERSILPEEQEVLAKYVGWGGLSEVFDENRSGQWKEARLFLKENLSEQEYENARGSTLTSFYTPKSVIDTIFYTLHDMGFRKGNILEPSCGVGNFFGNLPDSMNQSKLYGVELDSLSGRIAKQLYPENHIQIKGFEETSFSNNFFDIAIGNVPFGDFKVNDREYNKNNFLIHDYFFAKSIDKVRNGGIIAFITSSGTMDKKDETVRRYLASRAELIGAIRLPENTFKGIAGTEVTSDILFLKKRENVRERDESWIHLATDERGHTYNQYFVENPHMVLGSMEEVSGRFGNTLACVADSNSNFFELLRKASSSISQQARYEEIELSEEELDVIPATDDVKNFSFTIIDNEVYYRENSVFIHQDFSEEKKTKIRDYIELTVSLKDVIQKQKEDYSEEEIRESQQRLHETYNRFSIKYNFLNHPTNVRLFKEDSNFPLLSSIEVIEDKKFVRKGDIFDKRTIASAKTIDHVDTASEALILSVAERAGVDFDYMISLTGKTQEELIQELEGQIFLDFRRERNYYEPLSEDLSSGSLPFSYVREGYDEKYGYVTADEYLSGNVREKLHYLDTHLKKITDVLDEESANYSSDWIEKLKYEQSCMMYQKDRLLEAMPEELTASEISVRLGATWIPEKDIQDFIFETLKTPGYVRWSMEVKYSPFSGEWNISEKSKDSGDLATMTYGTKRVSAYKLIENSLNLRDTKVYDRIEEDGKEKSVLNKKETMLAGQKQEQLQEAFKAWIFKDSDRRHRLEKIYNERFNSIRNREYSGEHLSFQGMNPRIQLKEHQKNAVARTLFGGNTLLAHVVGAGKTYEMIASAMESKRLGLCTKSLIVVPNHLTSQWGREFMELYPGANIMVADKKDFELKNRRRFVSRIATGEYDAVVIGHSQFEKIPMSKEYQAQHIQKQIDEIVLFVQELKEDKNQNITVKELEKTRKKLEARLEKLHDDVKKDNIITFEEMGVDKLYVDESHQFKNLFFHTKMRNVAGISQSEALKSSDMYMKCRYLDEKTDGKGVVFATGTPISNSMVEMYTLQRYLQYNELEKLDLQHFDSWASTFGETQSSLELSPEGNGYRAKTRFSKFYNLPELLSLFKEFADVQTSDMLDLPVPKAHYEVIKTQPSEQQKDILKSLSDRAEDVRNKNVDPSQDNMLKITSDGKKLALDQRLIDPLLPDNPNSKVNVCVQNVFDIWEKNKEYRSTQLIFSDLSTPSDKVEFSVYNDIREKLISKGIPEKEIAFIHDAETDSQKEDLFRKVRAGDVRILLGSTPKMGAGTNVQDKLIALHDLDVPWRPADLEQRAGRIVRQGNENKDRDGVYIYRYVTENTFDAYLWQTIENKQKFISQIMTSKSPARVAEDVDESSLSYAEIKALATGNPLIKQKMELDNEVTKLKMLEANFKANKFSLEDKILKQYPQEITQCEKNIQGTKEDILRREPLQQGEEKFTSITLSSKKYTDKKEAGEALIQAIRNHYTKEPIKIGSYRNFDILSSYDSFFNEHRFYLKGSIEHSGNFGHDPGGNIIRMDNVLSKLEENLKYFEERLESLKIQFETAKEEVKKPFERAEELKSKTLQLAEINQKLDMDIKEEGEPDIVQEPDMVKEKETEYIDRDEWEAEL